VLILDLGGGSCPLCRCGLWSFSSRLQLPLPCHGGQERSGGVALAPHAHWLSPVWCYGASRHELLRAKHAVSPNGAVILGRQGGPSSTSKMEAPQRVVRRSSTLLHRQVVRPRRRRSGRPMRYFTGRMLLSILASYLDGNVSRSPASGGGSTRDLIAFLVFVIGFFLLI
jgi:hypothetical protein